MNAWDDVWHCYFSALRFIRHRFCIFFLHPSICRLKEGHLRKVHWWEDSLCADTRVLFIREWLLLHDFSFHVLSLHCESRSFVLLIEFLWFGRLKGALGALTGATIHQDLARNSHLIRRKTFFIIQELINMIQVRFSGKFSILWFSHALPIIYFTEKNLVRSRKNHRIDLH